MNNEFENFSAVPELTLEPFKEEEQLPAVEEKQNEIFNDDILSAEERRAVDAFATKIDLTDSTAILQFGAGTQKKMADFSESALENVKTKDLGEIGDLLSVVVKELKNFDEEEEKGFLGMFKKTSNRIQSMKSKYAKAETNIAQICRVLENHQVQLLKDIAILDKMYELNLTYFKELSMYVRRERRSFQMCAKESFRNFSQRRKEAVWLRTPRRQGILTLCAAGLRRSSTIWSLRRPSLCRRRRRSV